MRSLEDYLARVPPSQASVVEALCRLLREAAPEARESIKWAQPVWELNGPVCSVKAFRNSTNVNFWRGAELAEQADPDGLLLGQGGKMRHISVATVDEILGEALQRLVRSAIELNQRCGNPTRGAAPRADT
jgi:hypothetical protein